MLASLPMNPFDHLLATIEAFLDDTTHPGFGTMTTSADGAMAEVTFKPNKDEDFRAFATRVMAYADGATIVWQIQDRQIPLARVQRPLR